MIATWMVYATLIGILVSLAAHALDRAARANRLATRFVWLVAMLATATAPLVGYAIRRASSPADVVAGVSVGAVTGGAIFADPVVPSGMSRLIDALATAAERFNGPVALAWALMTLVLLSRLAHATAMLWRRQREWVPREIDGVPLFVTPDLGPAVVALPESRILVPQWLLGLDPGQVATVLRHEREHHAAGDARLLVVASIFNALLPWNAAFWWQTRRLRLAIEMDCDARVLRADPRVDRYGALLLAIAQHPRAALHAAATLTESTSDLERRIDAMTSTPSSTPRIVAAVCGACAVGAIFVACAMPAPDIVTGPTALESKRPAPISADNAFFEFQVEAQARPAVTNQPPKYPAQLRAAGIGGVVVAKFVVDTNGLPDMKSFVIVKSDHDLFSREVQEALQSMKFSAAEVGGHHVKQLVTMPFVFSLSSDDRDRLLDSLHMKRPGPVSAEPTRVRDRIPYTLDGTPTVGGLPTEPRRVLDRIPYPAVTNPVVSPRTTAPSLARTTSDTIGAQMSPTSLPPTYPNQLRAANIEGRVIASFVVRANGTVDMNTLQIVKSDHDLFAIAVAASLRQTSFRPATVRGVPVDWRLQMPFAFSLSR